MINLYELYKQNILLLITQFHLPYYWLDISKEKILNGTNINISDYNLFLENEFLSNYTTEFELGEDILKKGMFTPFFFIKYQNQKFIILGKHRLKSLLLNYIINPFNKKFLFIEIPFDYCQGNSLFLFNGQIEEIKINNFHTLLNCITYMGDQLTHYLWENNCESFPPFNDEQLFEKWLNEPNFLLIK